MPQGNVDFRRRFWNFPDDGRGLVSTLLVYADLLVIGVNAGKDHGRRIAGYTLAFGRQDGAN